MEKNWLSPPPPLHPQPPFRRAGSSRQTRQFSVTHPLSSQLESEVIRRGRVWYLWNKKRSPNQPCWLTTHEGWKQQKSTLNIIIIDINPLKSHDGSGHRYRKDNWSIHLLREDEDPKRFTTLPRHMVVMCICFPCLVFNTYCVFFIFKKAPKYPTTPHQWEPQQLGWFPRGYCASVWSRPHMPGETASQSWQS